MVSSKRYFSELYDRNAAENVAQRLHALVKGLNRDEIKVMTFCGTHEHTVVVHGLRTLLPDEIKVIAGPGCPVCVTPAAEVDEAIYLAKNEATVLTYGDMYQTPGSTTSLAQARGEGAKVRIVYGFRDAINLAQDNPNTQYVFFAIGFETTAPTVAAHVVQDTIPENLSLLVSYRITIPITQYMLEHMEYDLEGIIAPGHVATITGSRAWAFVSEKHGVPVVVTGFEPLDVLIAIETILEELQSGNIRLINEYNRVVQQEGNVRARNFLSQAFKRKDGYWRGIGEIPRSIWRLREKYSCLDARDQFDIAVGEATEIRPGCKCAEVTLGQAEPTDCSLFMSTCTPDHPYGPCMVSSEGTCRIWGMYRGKNLEETLSD